MPRSPPPPQARMGVSTGWGGGERLVQLVGRRQALRLLPGVQVAKAPGSAMREPTKRWARRGVKQKKLRGVKMSSGSFQFWQEQFSGNLDSGDNHHKEQSFGVRPQANTFSDAGRRGTQRHG